MLIDYLTLQIEETVVRSFAFVLIFFLDQTNRSKDSMQSYGCPKHVEIFQRLTKFLAICCSFLQGKLCLKVVVNQNTNLNICKRSIPECSGLYFGLLISSSRILNFVKQPNGISSSIMKTTYSIQIQRQPA